MKVLIKLSLVLLFVSCSRSVKFETGDCIQKPDESYKWKVLEKREHESIVEKHTDLGERNQKRISNSNNWVVVDC